MEEINLTTTVESILFDVGKAQEIVEIPKTEGKLYFARCTDCHEYHPFLALDCSASCHRRTLHGETEVVCNATDGGTSFSVHHIAKQHEEGDMVHAYLWVCTVD